MTAFEFSVPDWMQDNLRTPFGDWLMPLVSALGGGPLWLVLALALLLWPDGANGFCRAAAAV